MSFSIDLVIVAIFFLIIFIVGILERKKITLDDYWVNSRKTNKFVLVATVTSTYLGVASLISNAGITFSGAGFAIFALSASFFFYFFIFAKFFAPKIKEFGDNFKAYTLPDFLEHRYSKRTRVAGLILNLITYGIWLGLQILGMGIFVSTVSNFSPQIATLIGGVIIVAYTAIGGLRADIRTDVFQFLVMLSLILIFLPLVIIKSGGLDVVTSLPSSFLSGKEFLPWYLYLFGFFLIGASNLTSSDLWQRAYAADSSRNVMWAMRYSGVLIFLFLVAASLFGIYGRAIVPEATANTVIPELLQLYIPPGVFGIILAGFFAAIMSSADTVLLIMSMTIVHDLYQKTLNGNLSSEQVLKLSRWVTLIVGLLAIIIAVSVFDVVHLAIDAVSFVSIFIPAVVFGFYWKRATESAAFWSIVVGAIVLSFFIFITPREAFLPGIVASFITFFIVSATTRERMSVEITSN